MIFVIIDLTLFHCFTVTLFMTLINLFVLINCFFLKKYIIIQTPNLLYAIQLNSNEVCTPYLIYLNFETY